MKRIKTIRISFFIMLSLLAVSLSSDANSSTAEIKVYFNNLSGNNNTLNVTATADHNRAVISVGNGLSTIISSKDLNLTPPTTLKLQLSVVSADLSKTYLTAIYRLIINAKNKSGSSALISCSPKPELCKNIIFSWPHGNYPTYTVKSIRQENTKSAASQS